MGFGDFELELEVERDLTFNRDSLSGQRKPYLRLPLADCEGAKIYNGWKNIFRDVPVHDGVGVDGDD
jgi:hypothetical protein